MNKEAKGIAKNLGIADRVNKMIENESFITIKDHKEGFPHRVSCRLLNPTKTEIGSISKNILDKINKSVLESTNVNQLKNISSVIQWFENIKIERNCSFVFM